MKADINMLVCEAWEMPKVTQELVTGKARMQTSSNPCPYQDFERIKRLKNRCYTINYGHMKKY